MCDHSLHGVEYICRDVECRSVDQAPKTNGVLNVILDGDQSLILLVCYFSGPT